MKRSKEVAINKREANFLVSLTNFLSKDRRNKSKMEENQIIAEFMGWEEIYKDAGQLDYKFAKPHEIIYRRNIDELKYHTDWNWLMPVVRKITQETKEFKKGHIDSCLHTPLASALIRFTDLELVYDTVVKFIKELKQE